MSLRNNHKIHHHPKITLAGQLVCPHCHAAFLTTWRRYWAAPMGNYRCPKCRHLSHATANAWWIWLIIFIAMTLIGIVGVLLIVYVFHQSWLGAALVFMGYLAVGFLLDKWLDGHLRYLKIRS